MARNFISALASALAVSAVAVFSPAPSDACTCIGMDHTLEEALSQADSVFLGRVYGVDRFFSVSMDEVRADYRDRPDMQWVLFDVEASWKGSAKSRQPLVARRSSAACGVPFHVGERFIITASRQRNIGEPKDEVVTKADGTSFVVTEYLDPLRLGAPFEGQLWLSSCGSTPWDATDENVKLLDSLAPRLASVPVGFFDARLHRPLLHATKTDKPTRPWWLSPLLVGIGLVVLLCLVLLMRTKPQR